MRHTAPATTIHRLTSIAGSKQVVTTAWRNVDLGAMPLQSHASELLWSIDTSNAAKKAGNTVVYVLAILLSLVKL